jgi:uncharacterized membrane protein
VQPGEVKTHRRDICSNQLEADMQESILFERLSELPLNNPALIEHARERRQRLDNRIADGVTSFAGSMAFVWIHVIWFSVWIGSGLERYPYGLLTMIVSLEAIFLSTFVMISQNRADAKRQVVADLQWQTVQEEDKQNVQLLELSNQILELTKAIHEFTARPPTASSPDPP